MTSLLLCYAAALLLLFAGFFGIFYFLKKAVKIKPHWGMFFLGIIIAVVTAAAVVLLWRVTFRTDNYYNTALFRTLVGFVYLALLCFLRILIVRNAAFANYREDMGYSFCFGFGAAPGLFLGVYLLIMLPVVGFNGLFNGPCIVAEEGYLTFEDNTIITVFRPAAGHISFALAFLFFAVMTVGTGIILHKATHRLLHRGVPTAWTIFAIVIEAAAILPLPFFGMYGLQHWALAVMEGVLGAAMILLAFLMPDIKEAATYTKQFE